MLVMDKGRITLCGHPRKVLPQVEKQLQATKDQVGEESGGGNKGGASNKAENGSVQLQVQQMHTLMYI